MNKLPVTLENLASHLGQGQRVGLLRSWSLDHPLIERYYDLDTCPPHGDYEVSIARSDEDFKRLPKTYKLNFSEDGISMTRIR